MREGFDKLRGRSVSRSHVDNAFILAAAKRSKRPGDAIDMSIGKIEWELFGLAH